MITRFHAQSKSILTTAFLALMFYSSGYSQTITTFAGTGVAGSNGDGGPASNAQLHSPRGICYDHSGNILVVDWGNFKIRKIDGSGNISTIAGTGSNANTGDGGLAINADLTQPVDVAVNSTGDIFILSDFGASVRRIDHTTGIITTYAGNGSSGFGGDGGPATSAQFDWPGSMAFDASDNLYIADVNNNRIRVVNAQTGIISTYAGTGSGPDSGDGGLATSAGFTLPVSLAVHGSTLYVGVGGYKIRAIDLNTNIISTLTNTNLVSSTNAGTISYDVSDLAVDNNGNVYVAGGDSQLILKFSNGTHTVLAGSGITGGVGTAGFSGDGGLGTNAMLHGVYGILLGNLGELYVSDYFNNRIRKLKAQQTITFNTLPAKTNGDPSFTLNATASSGLAVTYASSNTSVATVSGNTVTIVGTGTSTITANQAGNTTFDAAPPVTQTLTVKASQSITFASLAAKKIGDVPFALGATTDSGLPITYASSNTSVATVSGNTITIVGAGTSTITASQAGDASFSAAADVTQSLTVNKGDQTITFAALATKKYGDAPFSPAASTSGLAITLTSSNTSVATASGNTITIVGLGTSTITASQPGNTNYNAATDVIQTLTVNKGDQSITFAALTSKKFGDVPFTLGATTSSGLGITFVSSNTSVATISGNTVTIVGAGTSTITANQAGNANYNAAADAPQTLTVNKADQAITFNTLSAKNQGDAAFALTAISSSGLTVAYTITSGPATMSGSVLSLTGGGTVSVKASQVGDANYNAAIDVVQSFCVNPGKPSISLSLTDSSNPVLTSSNAQGNQWYLNGAPINNATSSSYATNTVGKYTVQTTIGSCVSVMSDVQVLVVTAMEPEQANNELQCYPNPSDGKLTIQYSNAEPLNELEIVDVKGHVLHTGGTELLNTPLSIEGYGTGLYLVRIKTGSRVLTGKFLKK